MDSTDPSDVFSFIWTKDGGSHYAKWSDPKVDELADRAIKETDKAKRAKMYHDLQRMVLNGAPGTIPVGWVEGWFFTDKSVRGSSSARSVITSWPAPSRWPRRRSSRPST